MKEEESVNGRRIEIIGKLIDLASFTKSIQELDFEITEDSITLITRQTAHEEKRGRKTSKEITIRRFVNAESFTQMLGLHRADGSKTSERIRFANIDPILHKWFIESLRQMGVKRFLAYVYYCFCQRCGKEKLRKAIKTFEQLTGVKIRGEYYNELAHNPMFYTDVNNKPLAIFLNHAETIFRKEATKGNIPKSLVAKYLRGVFHGDGYLRLYRHNLGVDIEFWEKDANAAEDLKQILRKYYDIKLRTYYNYSHKCSINTEELLEIFADGIIPEKHSRKVKEKLMIAYKNKRLPWILLRLFEAFNNRHFTVSEASKVLQKSVNHTREKLLELQKRGYLTSIKTKIDVIKAGTPVRRIFRITNKALRTIKLLLSLFSLPFYPLFNFDLNVL